jgi:hypothetical protein
MESISFTQTKYGYVAHGCSYIISASAMAQYAAIPRPVTRTTTTLSSISSPVGDDCLEDLHESIYIFPNPPSATSPSSCTLSDFSAPTDIASSEFTGSKSRESSVHRDGTDTAPPATSNWTWVEARLESIEADATNGNLNENPGNMSLGKKLFQSDPSGILQLHRNRGSHSRAMSPSQHIVPQPPVHIPFLSTVLSLISVDESTVYLLTHTVPHSSLFPGHALPADVAAQEELDTNVHGLAKLFISTSSETRALRSGCRVACDSSYAPSNPFMLTPLPLAGLWGFVRDVVVNGGKALHEVYWGLSKGTEFTETNPTSKSRLPG